MNNSGLVSGLQWYGDSRQRRYSERRYKYINPALQYCVRKDDRCLLSRSKYQPAAIHGVRLVLALSPEWEDTETQAKCKTACSIVVVVVVVIAVVVVVVMSVFLERLSM